MRTHFFMGLAPALSVLGLVFLSFPLASQGLEGPAKVPEGLSTSDWSGIRAAYEAGRHQVRAVDGGFQAWNPAQRWHTRFDGRGFTVTPDAGGWSWGLELQSYGFAGLEYKVSHPAEVHAEGGRVAYAWDATLTEWYLNDTRGLEHGYTLRERPPLGETTLGDEKNLLTFTLEVRGGLHPDVAADGRSVRFLDGDGATVINYADLVVFDAEGRSLSARFRRVARRLLLTLDERGAVYPLNIDPIAQQAYLKASNTDVGDHFGSSVSVSGSTVVVGAPLESSSATGVNGNQSDNSAVHSGAAYVFVRVGTVWSQKAYLKASNTDAIDQFGRSVSVSGNTVVVGAIFEDSRATGVNGNQGDNSASGSGAAYAFVRNGTIWSQQAYLKASNTDRSDFFGISVSVSGDTVVVVAALEDSNATGVNGNQNDNSATDSGAAYVFVRSGTIWSQKAYLKASNTDSFDHFGSSVSVSGGTVVVGAFNEASNATGVDGNQGDNSAGNSGAAYVFVRGGTVWSQQAYLKASNTDAGDGFGVSVSVSGNSVVVGAGFEASNATGVDGNQGDNSAGNSGAAYVFVRGGTSWSQQAYLKASNTDSFDRFGGSVAASVSGDMVVVGAYLESSNATGVDGNQGDNHAGASGAAYVFSLKQILIASGEVLSVTSGGTIDYWIDFPDMDAGAGYQILLSVHGTGPTTLHGLLIPLTRDNLFRASRHGNVPSMTSGFQGTLDSQGDAAAQVVAPPFALPLKLIGHRTKLYLAVINSNFDLSSKAVTLRFTL